MARKKTPTKPKEPVRIRTRKLSNGNESLYLDIYKDGKRTYEFLKLYLVPETSAAARAQNTNTMQAAQAIKSRKIIELTNEAAGIKTVRSTAKITLTQFFTAYMEKKRHNRSKSTVTQVRCLLQHLQDWGMSDIRLSDIDKKYCLRFADKMRKSGLKQATQGNYFATFVAILNDAVRNEIIAANPFHKLDAEDKIRKVSPEREYLTADEVAKLIHAPLRHKSTLLDKWEYVKQAFLFSCFCGLRVSDLQALKWGDIYQRQGYKEIRLKMQKTRQELILPLSDEALKWLPERGGTPDTGNVFGELGDYSRVMLKEWTENAGIRKPVSWHTARHTFATMLLTYGADLYAVSKLLGHSDIKITQIYAKIIDAKKVEAVNLLNGKFDSQEQIGTAV